MANDRRTDIALGISATAALGVPFLLIAVAQQAMSTSVMAAGRAAFAAATLGLLLGCAPAHLRRETVMLARRQPVAMLAVACSAAVAPILLIGAAERHIPTGTTAVLLATTPLWIALGSAVSVSRETITVRQWVSLGLAVLGVVVACGQSVPFHSFGWCALPLGAALSYAFSSLALRRHVPSAHPLSVSVIEMSTAAVLLVPAAIVTPGEHHFDGTAWMAVAAAGVGCSGLGWMANTALIQRVGAVRASVVSYTAVIVSILLGAVVLDEPVGLRSFGGTLVLIGAVALFLQPARPSGTSTRRRETRMLELGILGFLAEQPQHAYALRRRLNALAGHTRPISDGALTPALRRLTSAGHLNWTTMPSDDGPPRRVYRLTEGGHEELTRRLVEPRPLDITDGGRFFTLLAFLHLAPDPAAQRVVLERRLAFLEEPGRSFFLDTDRAGTDASVFRQGMNAMARDSSRAERRWLRSALGQLATS